VERRATERGEDAEVWSEEDRKKIGILGPLFEKFISRNGTQKEEEEGDTRSFLETLFGK
jgi:hypothetical protein